MSSPSHSKSINVALKKMVESMQQGQEEIFEISEKIENDNRNIQSQLLGIKDNLNTFLSQRDEIKLLSGESSKKLSEVSSNFDLYSQEDIEKAYREANKLQERLQKKEAEIIIMINNIQSLEERIKKNNLLHKKSTDLLNKIEIFSGYIMSDFSNKDYDSKDTDVKWLTLMENEKSRISRDIHDGPAQSVASLVIKTDIIKKLLSKKVSNDNIQKELDELKFQLRNVINEIRKIIHDLRPTSLNELGLADSIKGLISRIEENLDIDINFKFTKNSSILNKTAQITCYRVVQEAINNIAKHSKAKNVNIVLTINQDHIDIIVSDDGIGFDKNIVKKKKNSFGLSSMSERIALINGQLDIESTDSGTKIMATIPNQGEKNAL